MGDVKRNNNKAVVIILGGFVLAIVVYLLASGANPIIWENNMTDFDLDLSSLDYTLPAYTKICIPDKKYTCSSEGCKAVKPTIFLLYNNNNQMIYRCDDKPCDEYEVVEDRDGMYTYFRPVGSYSLSVKIADTFIADEYAPDMVNRYMETVDNGLSILVSYGSCK